MYHTNRRRGRCRCCGTGTDCTCSKCNYVLILLFCGTRGASDQYQVRFQGNLIATITDDATADGCRVFVIGNVLDVCASVISSLRSTYGEDAVQIGQTTALDDVNNCEDEIEFDADCDEITVKITPLGGVSVHDLSYQVYTVCHGNEGTGTADDNDPTNCCSYTSGGPLSGGAGVPVSFDIANTCCCCCPVFIDCGIGGSDWDLGGFSWTYLEYQLVTIAPGGAVTVRETSGDVSAAYNVMGINGKPNGGVQFSYCDGIASGICFKGFLLDFTDGEPSYTFAPEDLCDGSGLVDPFCDFGNGIWLDEQLIIGCRNGRLAALLEPYEIRVNSNFPSGPYDQYGIYYSTENPASSLQYEEEDQRVCNEDDPRRAVSVINNLAYQYLCECNNGNKVGTRILFGVRFECPPS